MALSDKLFELRKKNQYSQEQLAEQLGVSRQAVSKWENGKALPETETLIELGKLYGVSLDDLIGEGELSNEPLKGKQGSNSSYEKTLRLMGIVACVGGVLGLIVWGLMTVFLPDTGEKISASSMIVIDGNGILLIICLVAVLGGAVLLLKSLKKH